MRVRCRPSKMKNLCVLCLLSLYFLFSTAHTLIGIESSQRDRVFLFEDFSDLSSWKPLYFKKIKRHASYEVKKENGLSFLEAKSNSSASALVHKAVFNVYEFPYLRFRILVRNIYEKGNAEEKSGDDYPLRTYVMFKYDPARVGFWDRIKYNSLRLLYGSYPPYATINYIWANRKHSHSILTSRYTKRAKMVVIESGKDHLNSWRQYQVNMLEDFIRAFGERPPALAQIAIMNDSDNTAEGSVSLIDYIEVSRAPENIKMNGEAK